MRLITIVTIFYFVITAVLARNIFSQSNFSFTVKSSVSLSVPIDDTGPNQANIYQSAAPGFSIGVFGGYDIGKNIKLVTGLDWKRKVALYTDTYFDEEALMYSTTFVQDAVDQLGITFLLSYYVHLGVNNGWYWSGGFSLDIFLAGTSTSTGGEYTDLSPYYQKKEVTLEIGGGYDFFLSKDFRSQLSLMYSQPVVNPYNDISIKNGFHTIKILRLGVGLTWLQ